MQGYRMKIIQCSDWLRQNPDADDQEKKRVQAQLKAYTFLADNEKDVCYELFTDPVFSSIIKGYILMLIDSVDMAKRTRTSLIYQMEKCLTANNPIQVEKYYDNYYS